MMTAKMIFHKKNKKKCPPLFQIGGMGHKMRFVWIFILTLMTAGVTPTNGILESWGVPQLLSLLVSVNK